MRLTTFALLMAALAAPLPAAAEFATVSDRATFIKLIRGKTLTRPLIRLQVSEDGRISGKGSRWDVSGKWTWQNGFFCRDLNWGGDDLGYNCQKVAANGDRIRFTSDRGTGQSADFRLR